MDVFLFIAGIVTTMIFAGSFAEDDLVIDCIVFLIVNVLFTVWIVSNTIGVDVGKSFLMSTFVMYLAVRAIGFLVGLVKPIKKEKMKHCDYRFTEDGTMYCCRDVVTHSTCENNCILCQRGEY